MGSTTITMNLKPPNAPEQRAAEHAWVVVNSGIRNTVARRTFDRVATGLGRQVDHPRGLRTRQQGDSDR
jgi:hypothetical protein